MFGWLKRILDHSTDPVWSCDLYRDKEAGRCAHVDGPLCDFPDCAMLSEHRARTCDEYYGIRPSPVRAAATAGESNMSWSVSAVGMPSAVAKKLAADFARIKCAEPEESIKNNCSSSIAAALAAMPESHAVQVEASGSQYVPDSTKPEVAINQLNVRIAPLYGFVE